MRRVWTCWRLAGLMLLGALGCTSTPKYNEFRPDQPEEYKLPPEGAYTGPVQIPKEYLNQTGPRKDLNAVDGLPPPSGMKGSGGPGRPGGP